MNRLISCKTTNCPYCVDGKCTSETLKLKLGVCTIYYNVTNNGQITPRYPIDSSLPRIEETIIDGEWKVWEPSEESDAFVGESETTS